MQTFQTYKKYPLAGFSPNLMEFFYIIGYSKDKINNLNTKIPETLGRPEILSVINNSNKIKELESNSLIDLIFPINPNIVGFSESSSIKPKKSTVIFSINPDDNNGLPIKNPNCTTALIFYEQHKENNKLFIPKAFCITSQYPYFSFFNELNRKILELFKKDLEIPIEIIIYNLINYIPSPINFDLELNLFPKKTHKTSEMNTHFDNSLNSPNKLIKDISNIIILNNNINNFNNYDGQRTYSSISKNSTTSVNSNSNSNINTIYKLKQLSGYPQIDMDILKLFKILPMELIIELYMIILMEHLDIIFFSKNLEILNPVMYIFARLAFPCDDSMFQWILSVSIENFIPENHFVGKPGSIMIGVNCAYDTSLKDTIYKIRENPHYIVDLDNKKMEFITTNKTEYDKVINFGKFIKQSIFPPYNPSNYLLNFNPNTNLNNNFFFKDIFLNLFNDLNNVCYKKENNLKNVAGNNPNLNNNNGATNVANERGSIFYNRNNNMNLCDDINFDFFDYKDIERIYKTNKEVQEIFYNFNLKILSVFYSFFNLKFIEEKNIDKFDARNTYFIQGSDSKNEKDNFNEYEKYFIENFKTSKRYDKFFLGFIVRNEVIRMYRMGLQFSEEYIYILKSSAIEINHNSKSNNWKFVCNINEK